MPAPPCDNRASVHENCQMPDIHPTSESTEFPHVLLPSNGTYPSPIGRGGGGGRREEGEARSAQNTRAHPHTDIPPTHPPQAQLRLPLTPPGQAGAALPRRAGRNGQPAESVCGAEPRRACGPPVSTPLALPSGPAPLVADGGPTGHGAAPRRGPRRVAATASASCVLCQDPAREGLVLGGPASRGTRAHCSPTRTSKQ
jgi:hypothetical protein